MSTSFAARHESAPSFRQQLELQHEAQCARLRLLAYELTVAEARERERIARGLHDEIGQYLTVARLKLGELRHAIGDGAASTLIDELGGLLAQASRATRSATFDLSSPVLQLGLHEALHSLADRLARDTRLEVRFEGQAAKLSLPEAMLAVVFRVVRELCLNVQKHAAAHSVCISTWIGSQGLSVCVADDGTGFQPGTPTAAFSRDGGFGLMSAQAQMQAIGGRLEIASVLGLGTRATVVLPLGA